MAAFFNTQLDFIYFFYGLAFIILGWVCMAIARGGARQARWRFMAVFGFLHGAVEWMDLFALIVGDNPSFAIGRLVLLIVSFCALMEFARLDAIGLGFKTPGRWVYAPLLLAVIGGAYYGGLDGANVFARYGFGLFSSAAAAFVLACHAKAATKVNRRWTAVAAIGFALSAFATGIVVPETDFMHIRMIDYQIFAYWTGVPIQLVRGLLACGIAYAIWGVWGQRLIEDIGSPRYSIFMQRQFVRALAAMATILVCGWVLTEYLGDIYKHNIEEAALGDLDLLSSRLSAETAPVESVVRVIAAAPSVRALLTGDTSRTAVATEVLTRDVRIIGASQGLLLDRAGQVVVAVGRGAPATTQDFADAAHVRAALAGQAGFHFRVEPESKQRTYITSFPVRIEGGAIVGVAVLKKTIDAIEGDLRRFDRSFFIIDNDGVVVMTNRPAMMYRTLWPLSDETRQVLAQQYGALNANPLLKAEIINAAWLTVDGSRGYVQRRPLTHGEWSLVTLNTPQDLFANRVLGIIVTLQMAILAIVYLVGRERWIHDNVQLEKRLELEELARNLDLRATTDPLTGLYNRRKFNRELAAEMLRAQRHNTTLSVILFDIDYFKKINDTYGHQTGDAVLTELSRFVSAHIRAYDVLARWGGEEFIILAPNGGKAGTLELAEKLRNGVKSLRPAGAGPVTCSFGVAVLENEDNAETLIARADQALYAAKRFGRDRVAFADAADTPTEISAL